MIRAALLGNLGGPLVAARWRIIPRWQLCDPVVVTSHVLSDDTKLSSVMVAGAGFDVMYSSKICLESHEVQHASKVVEVSR